MRDYAKLIEDVFQLYRDEMYNPHVISGNEAAAAELLAAHDREFVLLANANEAAAVARAREARAAEISAGLRRLARTYAPRSPIADALEFAADDIDAGRI